MEGQKFAGEGRMANPVPAAKPVNDTSTRSTVAATMTDVLIFQKEILVEAEPFGDLTQCKHTQKRAQSGFQQVTERRLKEEEEKEEVLGINI